MAVAPLNMVRRVAEYALTEIPREKIRLGVPNYGYDWALPYERGVTKQATFDLIKELGLSGAGYWQLMRLFRANWLLAEAEFEIL